MAPSCKEHLEPCVLYCTGCNTLVCLTCIEQTHPRHTFTALNKMILSRKKEVRDNHDTLQERLIQYRAAMNSYQDFNRKLEEMQTIQGLKIKERADDLHMKIDTLRDSYLLELDEFASKEKQTLTTKEASLQRDIGLLEQIMKSTENEDSDDDMVNVYASFSTDNFQEVVISSNSKALKLDSVPDVDVSQIFGQMKTEDVYHGDGEIEKSFSQELGLTVPADDDDKDQIDRKSVQVALTTPSDKSLAEGAKSFGCSEIEKGMGRICVTTFKNIWVSASESKHITMYHEDGSNIKTLPTGILVNDFDVNYKGEVFFTEKGGHSVWKSSVGILRASTRFATFEADTVTNGIHITNSDQLFVCLQVSKRGGKVARLSETGHIVQEIEFDENGASMFLWPLFVKQNHATGDILIIDERKVIAVDKLGKRKFTISEDTEQSFDAKNRSVCAKRFMPIDIETTIEGKIILSDYGNDRICMFDEEGHFLKIVLEGQGKPSGISLRSDGKLFVASSNGEIFHMSI